MVRGYRVRRVSPPRFRDGECVAALRRALLRPVRFLKQMLPPGTLLSGSTRIASACSRPSGQFSLVNWAAWADAVPGPLGEETAVSLKGTVPYPNWQA